MKKSSFLFLIFFFSAGLIPFLSLIPPGMIMGEEAFNTRKALITVQEILILPPVPFLLTAGI